MGPGGRGAQQDSGPSGEVKAGAGRERGRTWGPLLGSLGGVLWGSQAKIGLVSSDQKEQGFGELRGVLSKGHTHRRPWEWGEDFIPKATGESSQERTFTYDSAGCSLGGGAKSRSRALQAAWTHRIDTEAAM